MALKIENSLNLGGIKRDVDRVAPEALEDAAQHIGDVAQSKAPLLTGAALKKANQERRANPGELRESLFVRVVDDNTAEVGFSAYWAGWQHEDLTYRHEDGQPKYLEEPLATEADTALDILARHIREALGGSG